MAEETKTEITEVAEVKPTTPAEAAPAVAAPAVAEPIKTKAKVQVVEKPAPVATNLSDLVAQIKKSGTIAQKSLVTSIEAYMTNMAPGKPISNEDGDKYQYQFWKTIQNLVHNAPVDEFKSLWNLLLMFVHQYKQGVFHDRYLFRFSEYWIHSVEELNGFQRILNLINLTCDPATRSVGLRQVNLDATLADGFSEEARQRILGFYRV